ncbi:WXG100 family type VII secretion target [Paenibacillus sp. FSL W7-1332]|uniref:WXG100 family type VII secretion target n=1 Tax=Paenibacillus sp. FSL W7-1332 TaxID=2921702 RepID=UPI0030CD9527
MSRILVTPEMLLRVAEQCSRAHEQLEAMIHMLNQNIHMLESGWEGTTRSRFYADFQQAHREMTQTTEHIHRTSLELRGIAQRFKSADERGQPIQVAGHVLGAFPMMRGPAGHSAVEDAGRKAEEAWNSVQQEAGKAWDTVKQEAGELWEGVKIGAAQLGNSLMDTAISLYEDPLGTGKEMLYNATIGTVEDIWNTGIWAGRMLFSDEYREKIAEDVKAEVDSAGGWSKYLGQGAALILGEAILNRAGIRGRGPLNKKHDDLGGGNGSGSGSGSGSGAGDDSGDRGGDGNKSGDEGTGKAMGSMINDIRTKTPDQLLNEGWQDVTDPRKAENTMSREYYNPETGVKISYDPGKKGATGFEAVDHYHIHNPNYTDKKVDYYFDIDGNPVGKGSKASHIVIKDGE